jgi:hypothetical protein
MGPPDPLDPLRALTAPVLGPNPQDETLPSLATAWEQILASEYSIQEAEARLQVGLLWIISLKAQGQLVPASHLG